MFAVVLSAILMVSLAYVWPIEEPYHPLNEGWDGCSKIVGTAQNRTFILTYDELTASGSRLLAIIGPNREFSQSETSHIRSFLDSGGIVLLADGFGTGNGLLEALDVSARFSKIPIADLLYYSKEPSFPIITDFSPSPVTVNIAALLLNHPSYIEISNYSSVTKLASSSLFSFVDLNGDSRPEPNATIDSYPVLASTSIGRGSLILVSDPSIFVNEMIDLYDNMQLFKNLLNMGHDSLIFDINHLERAPLTDERIQFKNAVNSIRDLVLFSPSGVYIQLLTVVGIILGFSIRLSRRATMKKHVQAQVLYSRPN